MAPLDAGAGAVATRSLVAIGELCTLDRATIAPDDPAYDELRYVGLEHVGGGTGVIGEGPGSRTGDGRSMNFRFGPEHVLYGKLRPYLNKVAVPDFAGRCTTELIPLCPRKGVDRRYLAAVLRRPATVEAVMAANTGARMPRADMGVLLAQLVPQRSPAEQRRIVDLLDRAASIVRLRQAALAKAREVIPTLFVSMFGDPATNPMDWPVAKLGDLGVLDRGRSRCRPRNDPRLLGGAYPFIQTGDVANANGLITQHEATYSEFGLSQSRLWPKNTLCITIAANIAASAMLTYNACFPDSVVGFLPGSAVRAEYVQAIVERARTILEATAPQAAQKNINLRILGALSVPCPPVRMQEKYVAHLSNLRAIIGRQEHALTLATAAQHALAAQLLG